MKSNIIQLVRTCFYHLRRLHAVCRRLRQEITAHLVSAFACHNFTTAMLCRLSYRHQHADQCKGWGTLLAHLVCDLLPKEHVTSALWSLQWRLVKQINDFKLCLLIHLAVNGRAPIYLKHLIKTTALVPGQGSNHYPSNNDFVIQQTRLKFSECTFSIAAPRNEMKISEIRLQPLFSHLESAFRWN